MVDSKCRVPGATLERESTGTKNIIVRPACPRFSGLLLRKNIRGTNLAGVIRPELDDHSLAVSYTDALYAGLLTRKVNWVLDLDIRGFFDHLSHEWLVRFVEHRIADRRVVRLIQKWLNAGVLEDGKRTRAEEGTPQGGSASPTAG
jgi:Reverse transcriptase (RNA-dependent DNA polymerase)